MTAKTPIYVFGEEDDGTNFPERQLWLAVIERALKDYCFFFEKLSASGKGQILNYCPVTDYTRKTFNTRAIKELNRLRWFIYCKEPQQFNLAMLLNEFYDDGEGMTKSIRTLASMQFKKNMQEAEALQLYPTLIDYIKKNTKANDWSPAEEYLLLKKKRLRH